MHEMGEPGVRRVLNLELAPELAAELAPSVWCETAKARCWERPYNAEGQLSDEPCRRCPTDA